MPYSLDVAMTLSKEVSSLEEGPLRFQKEARQKKRLLRRHCPHPEDHHIVGATKDGEYGTFVCCSICGKEIE